MSENSRVIHRAASILNISKRTLYRHIDGIGADGLRELIKEAGGRLIKPSELAKMLSVNKSTIYRLFNEGKITGITLFGTTIRFREQDIQEIIKKSEK